MKNELEEKCMVLASAALSVANTPLFIVKALRNRDEVIDYSRHISPKRALSALKASLERSPSTSRQQARPFLFAIILFLQGKGRDLIQFTETPNENYRWIAPVCDFLAKSTVKTSVAVHNFATVTPRTGSAVTAQGANAYAKVEAGTE